MQLKEVIEKFRNEEEDDLALMRAIIVDTITAFFLNRRHDRGLLCLVKLADYTNRDGLWKWLEWSETPIGAAEAERLEKFSSELAELAARYEISLGEADDEHQPSDTQEDSSDD